MIASRYRRLGAVTTTLALLVTAFALHQASASNPPPLLPRLVADAPDGATLSTSSVEGRTRLLLRFNGYLHNDGEGALDIRAGRTEPTVSGETPRQVSQQVEFYKEKQESLPAKIEEELASTKMTVHQREFTTNAGKPANGQEYLGRPHVEEPTSAEVLYSSADGHHHWHLQHIARYSLWNALRTAEVAPSQKVGFCLDDSQHVESNKGPSTPVYATNVPPYTGYCRQWAPNATSLYEGISPGWRDVYEKGLAFQWVDASDVAPGEYWLREEVDPNSLVQEAEGGSKTSYSTAKITIPGFDAEGRLLELGEGESKRLLLPVGAYGDTEAPAEAIVSAPAHGTLGPIESGSVTYTPEPGYAGTDSFSFTARDPHSQFPESPTIGDIAITVNSPAPTLAIEGAKERLIAGTSLSLSAAVTHDSGEVEWEASAGAVTPSGPLGRSAIYTAPAAPPAGGSVKLVARLQDHHEILDERSLTIEAPAKGEPLPEVPSTPNSPPTQNSGVPNPGVPTKGSTIPPVKVSAPRVMLFGRSLVMSTVPGLAGRVGLSAYFAGRRLGACSTLTPAKRTFTCVVKLKRGLSLHAPIKVIASLHAGSQLWNVTRLPQPVPQMKMRPIGAGARASAASAGYYWCSPSTLAPVLVGG
jgi:Lysyl oxidase/Bacterial Ig domain